MCPTINRNLTPKKVNRDKEMAQKHVYGTTRWRALRILKLQNNPLCEECLKNDRITPSVEVHHVQRFMSGSSIEQIKFLGFDYSNLLSLCESCHQNKHNY